MAVTNLEHFQLTYFFFAEKVTVRCQRFDVDGKTLIWVPVLDKKGFIKFSYVVWENVKPNQRFFRFPLPEPKETGMRGVLEALEKQLPPR